jgi:G:T-mismatch repair DNA endonuclease (very short patch repair protein)
MPKRSKKSESDSENSQEWDLFDEPLTKKRSNNNQDSHQSLAHSVIDEWNMTDTSDDSSDYEYEDFSSTLAKLGSAGDIPSSTQNSRSSSVGIANSNCENTGREDIQNDVDMSYTDSDENLSTTNHDEYETSNNVNHNPFHIGPEHEGVLENFLQRYRRVMFEMQYPLQRVFQQYQDQYGAGCGYFLEPTGEYPLSRFNGNRKHYRLLIPQANDIHPLDYEEQKTRLRGKINSVISEVQRNVDPNEWFGMYLKNDNLGYEIFISSRRADQLDAEILLTRLSKAIQSGNPHVFEGVFSLTIVHYKRPDGAGRNRNSLIKGSFMDHLKSKTHSVVLIKNADKICLARAVVVAKAYADTTSKDRSTAMWMSMDEKTQKEAALNLLSKANIPERSCGLEDIQKIADQLPDYRFIVFSVGSLLNCMYKDPVKKDKIICLLYDEAGKHYNVITSLPGFFGSCYYCIECETKFSNKNRHKCTRGCKACGRGKQSDCEKEGTGITCNFCNRFFFSNICFNNHKTTVQGEAPVCRVLSRCHKCNIFINLKKRNQVKTGFKKHCCGEIYCRLCKGYFENGHQCYMQQIGQSTPSTIGMTENNKKTVKKLLYIFYDFEATQETILEGVKKKTFEHRVNFVVAKQRCYDCMYIKRLKECPTCGERKHIFSGENSLTEFNQYMLELNASGLFEITAIAHNSSGYDAQFIAQHCFKHGEKPQKMIVNGTKITYMTVRNIRFVDSYLFLPMPLSKFPEAFGLSSVKKGDFPHFFNRKANWNYIGPIPPFDSYGADSKSPKEKEKLLKWWTDKQDCGDVFDFQKEIREYCESDVDILEQGCLKFREAFMLNGIDPFRECTTIASACNRLFRTKFLTPNTIGLMNPKGYSCMDKQSHIAISWLNWEAEKQNIRIQHAGNGREVRIANKYKADGFCAETNTVFEFHGCAFHGCPSCYQSPVARKKLTPNSGDRTMEQAYEDTVFRAKIIRDKGFTLVEKWECEFRRQLKNEKELREFWIGQSEHHPINPRDAFFGGRTNATTLHYKCKPGEIISYDDVCSLYPYVNKYGKYPVGHPIIKTSNLTRDISQYEGLIKCKVLPPNRLYHPVLPVRIGSKLLFPLCYRCAEERLGTESCMHSDEQRAFTGTWVSDELKKAVEKGYTIVKVFEVWHFDRVSKYIPGEKDGLFNKYIDHFLKMKVEASGYPSDVKSDSEKNAYILKYYEKEGVRLDKSNIEFNPGMRVLSKLCLNSFWGKFGQRNNLTQVEYITTPGQLNALLMDETREVTGMCFPSDSMVQVQWRYSDDFVEASSNTNPFIAAYTTAHARLKLYSYLELLGKRVLYFDTDSVIYVTRPGEKTLPRGVMLGELTNELESYGLGAYMIEFVSGGPKNYAYIVVNSDGEIIGWCCKVKGITMNATNSALVNFESMKNIVTSDPNHSILLKEMRISRTKDHKVVTTEQQKTFRAVYTKRQLQPDLTTLPWGYK